MKSVVPLVAVALLILAGIGAFWLLKQEPAAGNMAAVPSASVDPDIGKVIGDLLKEGSGSAVIVDGKVVKVQFNLPGAETAANVSIFVSDKDGKKAATIRVT